jgi:divalent metal cation (Fe/Co/Zn/Cd) transporter
VHDLSTTEKSSREKTLLTSVLLSSPAPLVTGIAFITSQSTTQLADFIRRSIELTALFVAWWVFRRLHQKEAPDAARRTKLEFAAGMSTATAMTASGTALLVVALSRLSEFEPGGNVILGLTIATLGVIVNGGFWRRYARFAREKQSSVMEAQQRLYRAKTSVDVGVVTALSVIAIAPGHPAAHYVDILGSIIVSAYLLWSGLRAAQPHLPAVKELIRSSRESDR